MRIKTWTTENFLKMLDMVISDKSGYVPTSDNFVNEFNLDSLDILEILTTIEEHLETEIDPGDFSENITNSDWTTFKENLMHDLKVNGYLVIEDE